jgi:hypothetical protein
MGRWIIVAFAATALVVAASATSQVVVGRTVFRSARVPAGGAKTLSVSCPSGYFAVSAGVAKSADGVNELEVQPLRLRTYAFRLANAGAGERSVTVAAACRRVRASASSGLYLKLTARRRVSVRVQPSGLRRARFTCPSGTVPAAAGFNLGGGKLSIREQKQDLRVLTFAASNVGAAPRTASFYAGCLTVIRPAGASRAQLKISLATETVPIETGSRVFTRLCPSGWLSLAAGYSVPAGVVLNGAAAVARTGRWSFTNPAAKPVLAQLQLTCVRLT